MKKKRLVDASKSIDDKNEVSLRPISLDDYIGQDELKNNLKIFIGAALHRNEVLDHVLLYGPPGLGKTTLAYVIAHEMGGNIKIINGPSIEKTGELATILSTLEAGDILFIDEIHRLPKIVEEVLYSAMEDYVLSIVIPTSNGMSSTLNLDLPPFTLVGATTRAGDLSSPLRARFGITQRINFYTEDELTQIVLRTSSVFNTKITPEGARLIAKRSRGTPRVANRIFRRVRDFVNYEQKDEISTDICLKALNALKIDELGLDEVDIKYLSTLLNRFGGGPVGLETLAFSIGEEIQNLEDVYEPYLLQIDFINRTPKGRIITKKGASHIANE